MKVLSCAEMRAVEKRAEQLGVSGLRLMENAGTAAAREIKEIININRDKVVVVCGKGNNGGDGYVVARKLFDLGVNVQLISLAAPVTEAAIEMRDKAIAVGIRPLSFEIYPDISEKSLKSADLIVDAIFGTGFSGEVEGIYRAVIDIMNKTAAKKVALDVPSGINGDSGVAGNCFKADMTVSFANLKLCHVLYPSNEFCGKIKTVSIGLPEGSYLSIKGQLEIVTERQAVKMLPSRSANFHKGNAGTVVSLCGSVGYAGAAVIAAKAAVKSGAGIVNAIVPSEIYNIVATAMPEIVCTPVAGSVNGRFSVNVLPKIKDSIANASTLLIGCGMGRDSELTNFIEAVLKISNAPVVIDADGINNLVDSIDIIKQYRGDKVITPHPKEAARLLGCKVEEILENRIESAKKLATLTKAIVVLKGANSLIALKDGTVKVVTDGNPGMATAGTGDMLAGMIAAFLSQGLTAQDATCLAVKLHAMSGDMAAKEFSMLSMTPSDMINLLPKLFLKLYSEKQGI